MGNVTGMTGFGRGERSGPYGTVTVEARSVNGKGLDLRLRLPNGFDAIEPKLRELAKARFNRGSVTLNLSVTPPEGGQDVRIDEDRLSFYAKAARRLYEQGAAAAATGGELLALKGVVIADEASPTAEDAEALHAAGLLAAAEALDSLKAARDAEGAAMVTVLTGHLGEIETLRADAASNAEALPEAIKARIKAKFDELLPSGLDPERLEQEAAMLAVKADIREELDRLTAHIEAAHALLAGGSPAGRKLDFLAQEFNREANTLCSKSADPALTRTGLALKAAVDRLREQVQNVE
jgi:uncharacterized protein (TIGR00255 family)